MHDDLRTDIDSSQALTDSVPVNEAGPRRLVKISAARTQRDTELDAQARDAVCKRLCTALSEAVGTKYTLLRIEAGVGAGVGTGDDGGWRISTCTTSKRPAAQCPNDDPSCETTEATDYVTATCVAGR